MKKKYYFLILFFLINLISHAQNKLNNAGNFNVTEIDSEFLGVTPFVQNLFPNECQNLIISNITYTSSGTYGLLHESLGGFTNNSPNIPFNSGMILSTGFLNNVPGPNVNPIPGIEATYLSDGEDNDPENPQEWANYADDFIYLFGEPTNDEQDPMYKNGTTVSFEFMPLTNSISFNFLFLSEEYDQNFECGFADVFVFALQNLDTGSAPQNLAVIPGTNTPIQATSIHPTVFNTVSCPAENEDFFSNYNFTINPNPDSVLAIPANQSPTGFNGQTNVFTAQGDVVPGQNYRITMAIADFSDAKIDSAILIENGSFNASIDLGDDVAFCIGDSIQIGSNPIPNATYQWSINTGGGFTNISGATQSTYTTTQAGEYQVNVTINGCDFSDTIVVTSTPLPVAQNPGNLTICDETPNDGFGTFDLTSLITTIQNGQTNTTVNFYTTLTDATNGTNAIPDPNSYENTIANQQTIYVTLISEGGCFDIISFDIIVEECCVETDCPAIDLNKSLLTITRPGTYDPGQELTFRICAKNIETDSCPIDFTITDYLDPIYFDLDTFDPINFSASLVNETLSIDVQDLEYNTQNCYTFKITLRDDVLPEEGINCASIIRGIPCGAIENCASFDINLPDTLWPRTFGSNKLVKRYNYGIENDQNGNTYVVGRLRRGDTSFEDPSFLSPKISYLMKFDVDGHLVWVKYFNLLNEGEGRKIRLYNNHLYVSTTKGILFKYDFDGNEIMNYEYGNGTAEIEINENTGDIFLAQRFHSNYSNDDYNVFINPGTTTRIIKLDNVFNYKSFVDFFSIEGFYSITDMEYVTSTNHLYVTGHLDGVVFDPSTSDNPDTATVFSGADYLTLAIKDNFNSLNITDNFVYTDEIVHEIEFDSNQQDMYLSRGNSIYKYATDLSQTSSFYGAINNTDLFINDMRYDPISNSCYASFDNPNTTTSYLAKLGNPLPFTQGIFWLKSLQDKEVATISISTNDHIMIAGYYTQNTTFDSFYRDNYTFDNSTSIAAFIARVKDLDNEGEFRISPFSFQENSKKGIKEKCFSLAKNPVEHTAKIISNNDACSLSKIIVKNSFGANQIIKENINQNHFSYNVSHLKSGVYFVVVYANDGTSEVIKMIVK